MLLVCYYILYMYVIMYKQYSSVDSLYVQVCLFICLFNVGVFLY